MSVRLVAVLVAVSLSVTACAPLGICQPEMPCTTPEPVHTSSHDDGDDTGITLAVGVAGVALLVALIAVARNHDDTPKPAIAQAAPERVVYFAPAPPTDDETEQLRLQRMYVQGQVLARAGRCDGVWVIGRHLARVAPAYYQVYAADPVIASCAVDKLSNDN